MRVLIIDDEENIRRTTGVALEGMGHETIGAENADSAFKHLAKDQFDVVFLDLKLNGENGLDLLPELLTRQPQLAVVVFTAQATIETAMEALRLGAVDYISKPFTLEQIRQVLSKILQTRMLEDSPQPAPRVSPICSLHEYPSHSARVLDEPISSNRPAGGTISAEFRTPRLGINLASGINRGTGERRTKREIQRNQQNRKQYEQTRTQRKLERRQRQAETEMG